jgi:hypothetical protein
MIPDNVCTTKFHVSTALRTAVSIHVAEILRDAGPQVMNDLFTSFLTVDLLIHRVNMLETLPSLRMFTQENWVRIKNS